MQYEGPVKQDSLATVISKEAAETLYNGPLKRQPGRHNLEGGYFRFYVRGCLMREPRALAETMICKEAI